MLEFAPYIAHKPPHYWHEYEREQGELPTYEYQSGEISHNEYRVLEKHVERRHNRVFHLVDISAHARYDIALALLGEKAERQRHDFLVEEVANVVRIGMMVAEERK